jgi:accessory gene regulator protein AgrB
MCENDWIVYVTVLVELVDRPVDEIECFIISFIWLSLTPFLHLFCASPLSFLALTCIIIKQLIKLHLYAPGGVVMNTELPPVISPENYKPP